MNHRAVSILLALSVVIVACGTDGGESADTTGSASQTATADGTTRDTEPAETVTTEAAENVEPDATGDEESSDAGAASGVLLKIGDEEWTFDEVQFCGEPEEPATTSFLLLASEGEWQLFVEVHDDTGERRLEGDGVYDSINLQNNADTTQTWLANLEASPERFIIIDDGSVTAETNFDAVTGLSDDTPGTLTATCP